MQHLGLFEGIGGTLKSEKMIKFRKGIGIFWITFLGYGFGVIDCTGHGHHFKRLLFGKYFITFIKPLKYK